jgi:hypothetical protein
VVKYGVIYDQGKGPRTMQLAIDRLAIDVGKEVDRLDQTVKDLLQFVCILTLLT